MARARSVRRFVAAAAVVLSAAWTALADPPRPPTPTRADMARAYIAFERAYFVRPKDEPSAIPTPPTDPAVVERANRAIDKAAVEMFGRNSAAAWARLRAETAWLELGREPGPVRRAADAFRAVADPPVIVLEDGHGPVTLTFTRLVDGGEGAGGEEVGVVLVGNDRFGQELNELRVGTVRLPSKAGESVTLEIERGLITEPGRRRILLDTGADGRTEVGAVQVSNLPLSERRERVLDELKGLASPHKEGEPTDSPLESPVNWVEVGGRRLLIRTGSPGESPVNRVLSGHTDPRRIEVARARASLLTDTPGFERSTDFLLDLNALAERVGVEGPPTIHFDDFWGVFFVGGLPNEGGVAVPVRVAQPAVLRPTVGSEERRPLLIVLHGAGGDENMFFEGYGAGMLAHLASTRYMVVAAPLNSPLAAGPEVFDALVDQLAQDYTFDRRRVYVLGHSMGTGAATAWSRLRSDKIAAAVNIAGIVSYGEGGPGAKPLPPTLVVIPELDGLIPPARMNAVADAAEKAGLPVTIRRVPDYGHALVVGRILPEAVDWLLQHRLPDRAGADREAGSGAGKGVAPAGGR